MRVNSWIKYVHVSKYITSDLFKLPRQVWCIPYVTKKKKKKKKKKIIRNSLPWITSDATWNAGFINSFDYIILFRTTFVFIYESIHFGKFLLAYIDYKQIRNAIVLVLEKNCYTLFMCSFYTYFPFLYNIFAKNLIAAFPPDRTCQHHCTNHQKLLLPHQKKSTNDQPLHPRKRIRASKNATLASSLAQAREREEKMASLSFNGPSARHRSTAAAVHAGDGRRAAAAPGPTSDEYRAASGGGGGGPQRKLRFRCSPLSLSLAHSAGAALLNLPPSASRRYIYICIKRTMD